MPVEIRMIERKEWITHFLRSPLMIFAPFISSICFQFGVIKREESFGNKQQDY